MSAAPGQRELSAYHSRLPYGEQVSPEPVLGGPFFPFDGDLAVVPLDEPVVPEPPRDGERRWGPAGPGEQSPERHPHPSHLMGPRARVVTARGRPSPRAR